MAGRNRIAVSRDHRYGIAVITVGGEIDLATAPALEGAVAEVLATDPTALIVDLSAVEFMGSVGLKIMVAAQQRLGAPGRVAVVANNPATRRPIQLTGLDDTLPLYPTLDEAVAALNRHPK